MRCDSWDPFLRSCREQSQLLVKIIPYTFSELSHAFIVLTEIHDGNLNSMNRYKTDYGMFRFCIADSEHDWRKGSEQYRFLEHCLATVDRRKQPWLIFAAHRPLGYSSNEWYAEEGAYSEPMGRDDLQKLWQKYRVDIAFFGHVHNYERTCPIYQVMDVIKISTLEKLMVTSNTKLNYISRPYSTWTSLPCHFLTFFVGLQCWCCRIHASNPEILVILESWMEQSMLLLEVVAVIYHPLPRKYPAGAFSETMTLALQNWQHSTTLICSSSTRKAVMERCMIPSPLQGNTRMSWLVFMTVVHPALWLLENVSLCSWVSYACCKFAEANWCGLHFAFEEVVLVIQ